LQCDYENALFQNAQNAMKSQLWLTSWSSVLTKFDHLLYKLKH